jgi:hypothetical protein
MTPSTTCRLALVLVLASRAFLLAQSDSRTSIAAHLKNLPAFLPVDEARQDPSLEAVRKEVVTAVRAKDAKRLMPFITGAFVLDGERRDGNRQRFGDWLMSVPHAEDWILLNRALSLGGAFTTTRGAVEGRREFCAPYVYARFPLWADVPEIVQGETLPWAIVANQAEVHGRPDLKSPVIARLSYVMVQGANIDSPDPSDPRVRWQEIVFADNQQAYVRADTIQDPEGPSVCFAKVSDRWMVSAFDRHSTIR